MMKSQLRYQFFFQKQYSRADRKNGKLFQLMSVTGIKQGILYFSLLLFLSLKDLRNVFLCQTERVSEIAVLSLANILLS